MSFNEERTRSRLSSQTVFVPGTPHPFPGGGGTVVYFKGFPGPRTTKEALDKWISEHDTHSFLATGVDVFETTVDRITPGFHEIVKKGEFRPINPMSKSLHPLPIAVTDFSSKLLGMERRGKGYPENYEAPFSLSNERLQASVPTPATLADESDVNALMLEAKASLKAAGMDYLTTLAEYRETLGMFLSMKQNLLNRRDSAVKAWSKDLAQKKRSGKFSGFNTLKEGWEAFSAFWLEYRFGWRILAYDIQAINDYYKRRNDGVKLFTRRSTETFTDTSAVMVRSKEDSLAFTEYWHYFETTETVRAGYSAFIDQSVLGNPIALNTLYDITPWTLVVDMFFNVQNNIQALSVMPIGVSEVADSGFVSSKCTTTLTILPKVIPKVGLQVNEQVTNVLTSGINSTYYRKKVGEPSFDISFQPNLDFGKIIDLATLALPIFRIIRKSLK